MNCQLSTAQPASVQQLHTADGEFGALLQILAAIGEQWDDGEEVCGVVVNVRPKQDRLQVWTKTASNEAAQVRVQRRRGCSSFNSEWTGSVHVCIPFGYYSLVEFFKCTMEESAGQLDQIVLDR